eukprot:gnl/MRDRNA2_/MRDRNA2_58067_c0_seq1.p1 gnl/MRDRNA2_/MRDRNA2_58067_c0~~gnl/MRDRNA2_/MRDRNA2_58067_c0_seq1.p1  ORF type:complete len:1099 (+),score=179.81 gnl/MRDRNA2_/MRDRNA2_58067_c0_seq1:138-3434(+)
MVDVIVTDAHGLPEHAYLSMRVGETRKQAPCRIGESWHFPLAQQRTLLFDIFQKVGSTEVDLSSLSEGCTARSENICIQNQSGQTLRLSLNLKHTTYKSNGPGTPKVQRHQAALRAKQYLEQQSVQNLLQAMVAKLLEDQPDNPVEFVCSYLLDQKSTSRSSKDVVDTPVRKSQGEESIQEDGDHRFLPQGILGLHAPSVHKAKEYMAEKNENRIHEASNDESLSSTTGFASAMTIASDDNQGILGYTCSGDALDQNIGASSSDPFGKNPVHESSDPIKGHPTADPKEAEACDASHDGLESAEEKESDMEGSYVGGGFPHDALPPVQPDLSEHHSVCAEVLRQDPELWYELGDAFTSRGVSAALCIKPAMENVGHPFIQTMGLVAGDEECYGLFHGLFDPAIQIRHNGYGPESKHPTNLDYRMVSNSEVDSTGLHVTQTRVRVSRNISGFLLPPALDKASRHEVERSLVKCFFSLPDDMKGTYYPIAGSLSYPPRPGGMSCEDEEELRELGVLFQQPDTPLMISSGYARDWPDARGIFLLHKRDCAIWVNFEDHCQLIALGEGSNIKATFTRLCQIEQKLHSSLIREGLDWIHTEHLGFVTSDPANLGTTLQTCMDVRIPKLAAHQDFRSICKALGIHVRRKAGTRLDPTWEVSNLLRLGQSEVVIMDHVIFSCKKLVEMELDLVAGFSISIPSRASLNAAEVEESVLKTPFSHLAGLGDSEYPGFSIHCSNEMPNLKDHRSAMAMALKADPSIWTQLKDRETGLGVTFGRCIKSGMDDLGSGTMHIAGLVAGDEECYPLFRPLFDPVISLLHDDFSPDEWHESNLNFLEVSNAQIDPSGKYAGRVKIECTRNIRGFRLPSAITVEERRSVEILAVKAFVSVPADLQGSYYPLMGSFSYLPNPGGMSESEKDMLEEGGFLLKEPAQKSLLSSGMGRHWPDARGVFVDNHRSFIIWVNNEDHLTMKAFSEKGDIKGAFQRLCLMESSIQKIIASEGFTYMKDDRIGFITSCPSNLGTGLRVSVLLKVPELFRSLRFEEICRSLQLKAKMSDAEGDEGWVEITMPSLLGTSEVDLMNGLIAGCKTLIDMENLLERGDALP